MSCKRTLVAVVLAATAAYLWGFAYWGLSGLPYATWGQVNDQQDAEVAASLREHFPGNGTYYLPGLYLEQSEREGLHTRGPVAFVHITSHHGRPVFDGQAMWQGYLLYLAVAAILAMLFRLAAPALTSLGKGLGFAALFAAAAAAMIDFGEAVWWHLSWSWILARAFYDFVALLIGAAVLLWVMRPHRRE